MDGSSPFLSSCSRRELARRRGGRLRHPLLLRFAPALLGALVVLAGTAAFMAGHGGL